MGDERELLEQERKRHQMGDDAFRRLQGRRERKRRNRMITSGVLALVIAAAGVTGAALAFRGTGATQHPAATPTGGSTTGSTTTTPGTPVTSPRAFPPQPSGPIQFVDADHGWWVDQNGRIVATTDGGGSSSIQYSGMHVTSVQFVDADNGWAIAGADLLRTVDGGDTWAPLGVQEPLQEVQFVTPQEGWGILDRRELLIPGPVVHSTDGGATWAPIETPKLADSICFIDGRTGWAVMHTDVFRTSDGGATWQRTTLDVAAGDQWTATVRCASDSDAWVLLTDGGAAGHLAHVLFHSGDGTTWTPVLQEAGTNPVGQRSDVYESNDPYPGQMVVTGPYSLAFVGWCPACGNSVDLFRTDDGGKVLGRLQIAAPDHGGVPQGVSFIDPDHGWVLLTIRTDKGPEAGVVAISGTSFTVWSQKTVP